MAKPSKARKPPRRSGAGKDRELDALGKRLCELREAAGLTQEGLAQRMSGSPWNFDGDPHLMITP